MAGSLNTTPKGSPSSSFSYLEDATSPKFNKLLLSLLPVGIYSGCTLSVSAGLNPVMSAGVIFLTTNNGDVTNTLGVRDEFSTAYEITGWSPSTPYVVVRHFWANQTNAYPDILCVATPDPIYDVIIGKFTSITSPSVYVLDSSQRMTVSRAADGLLLNSGLTSTPTGGTSTNLPGSATIWTALNILFQRLIDLSGVQNASVGLRHLNLGNAGGQQVNAGSLLVGGTFTLQGTGIITTDTIEVAIGKLAAAIFNLSGVAPATIGAALLNLGVGAGQVNSGILPSTNTDAFGTSSDGTITPLANTDTVAGALTKIVGGLKNLSGVADSTIKNRHINWGIGAGQINAAAEPTGAAFSPIGLNYGTLNILNTDVLTVALGKIITLIQSEDSALNSLAGTVSALSSTVSGHTSAIAGKQDALPIGTILMFDAAGWVDNGTLVGWYACTTANHTLNNVIPDLEGSFIRGISPSTRAARITANIPLNSGSGQIILSAANLPSHTHGYLDRINTGTAETNVNGGNAGGSDLARTTDGGNGLNADPINIAAAVPQYAVIYIKRIA